jgi:2-phospho-L-lactate guanylyltransferase
LIPDGGVARALVPAKALGEAKGRLAEVLSPGERRQLALAMLKDVLTALKAAPSIHAVSVVSPDAEVLHLAAELGATTIAESANIEGLNQALTRALSAMSPQPQMLLVVTGDVPEATADDIEKVLAAVPERGIAICPSPDEGTSALALRPPHVIPFSFGVKSFHTHMRWVEEMSVEAEVVRIPSLSRDIDSPEQLRAFMGRRSDTATYRLLSTMGIAERV